MKEKLIGVAAAQRDLQRRVTPGERRSTARGSRLVPDQAALNVGREHPGFRIRDARAGSRPARRPVSHSRRNQRRSPRRRWGPGEITSGREALEIMVSASLAP